MQGLQFFNAVTGDGAECKAKVGVYIQAALLVLAIKFIIALAMLLGIHPLAIYQKFPPGVITVATEQGIIKVKYSQCHRSLLLQAGKHNGCYGLLHLPL